MNQNYFLVTVDLFSLSYYESFHDALIAPIIRQLTFCIKMGEVWLLDFEQEKEKVKVGHIG